MSEQLFGQREKREAKQKKKKKKASLPGNGPGFNKRQTYGRCLIMSSAEVSVQPIPRARESEAKNPPPPPPSSAAAGGRLLSAPFYRWDNADDDDAAAADASES